MAKFGARIFPGAHIFCVAHLRRNPSRGNLGEAREAVANLRLTLFSGALAHRSFLQNISHARGKVAELAHLFPLYGIFALADIPRAPPLLGDR